ncbi:MAG: PIN domain-containing protein [Micrococcales bacterium]|nr:PIN domain-containing protein [Micrococcales bacterium]MCL2668206.1 PIN domain-containing protein [Micrococcales bacterium]
MTPTATGRVVVDTGVFGARLAPSGEGLEFAYRPVLADRAVIISFVTVAELRFGAALARWGDRRMRQLEDRLHSVTTVGPGHSMIATYVDLRCWCVQSGHGLGQKDHEADRWVAATALHLGVPLVAHDRIFRDVTGLELLTLLD